MTGTLGKPWLCPQSPSWRWAACRSLQPVSENRSKAGGATNGGGGNSITQSPCVGLAQCPQGRVDIAALRTSEPKAGYGYNLRRGHVFSAAPYQLGLYNSTYSFLCLRAHP